jgi:triacylglycerol lipase
MAGMDFQEDSAVADISIWKEALFGADILLLHASPTYYGLGVPHGDGSAVIVIPGFLGTDLYLSHLQSWLDRIGYRAYLSGIGLNAECPNLLIQQRLNDTLDRALDETGRKVHLIGHSLGGVMACSVASRRPEDIASVITLAAPLRGTVAHHSILRAAESVRQQIHREHGDNVLPHCYTAKCTCEFVNYLRCQMPESVRQSALYTRDDGIVDWRYCVTGREDVDCEVPGTHIGLVFNASVYKVIAERLASPQAT